ncbi:hypothetical protein DHX103_03285 [Planococcus sp. X10-3]|uniref:hypothetical protein n=1 Tax=Planococcus sp. X10-3 TaxID=3061240 RepID=UPI003BAEEA9A
MAIWINQYKYQLLIASAVLALLVSTVIREDAFMYFNIAIVGVVATYILLKKEILLLLTIILISIFNEGITQFNASYIIFYLYGLMLVTIFTNKNKNKAHIFLTVAVIAALTLSLVPAIVNGNSIPLLIVSVLKRFGFFIIFLFALNMVDLNKSNKKVLDTSIIVLLLLNFLLAVGQFIEGSLTQDFITGAMGPGTTGVFIYLLMFYLAIASSLHYQKKISTMTYLALALVPIIYSAIAEVKIGFVSSAILLIIYLLFIKKGFKASVIFVASCFVISAFYSYFISLYPEHDFLNAGFLESYLVEQSYGDGNTLNRFGFKSTVDAVVYSNDTNQMVFGKGLGSGNPSGSSMFQGEVFKKYDFLKYSWFLMPYLYIEAGLLGTGVFLLIYMIPLWIAIRQYFKTGSSLAVAVLLMGIVNVMFIFYNAGLFTFGVTAVFWIYTAMLIREMNLDEPEEADENFSEER